MRACSHAVGLVPKVQLSHVLVPSGAAAGAGGGFFGVTGTLPPVIEGGGLAFFFPLALTGAVSNLPECTRRGSVPPSPARSTIAVLSDLDASDGADACC